MGDLLRTTTLESQDWLVVVLVASTVLVMDEFGKIIRLALTKNDARRNTTLKGSGPEKFAWRPSGLSTALLGQTKIGTNVSVIPSPRKFGAKRALTCC